MSQRLLAEAGSRRSRSPRGARRPRRPGPPPPRPPRSVRERRRGRDRARDQARLDRPSIAPLARSRSRASGPNRDARVALATRALTGSLGGLGEIASIGSPTTPTTRPSMSRRFGGSPIGRYESGLVAPAPGGRPRHVPARGGAPPLAILRRRRPDDPLLLGGDRPDPRRDRRRSSGRRRRPSRRCGRPPRTTCSPSPGSQAAEAARRTATAWADEPGMGPVMAEDADLWLPSA